MPKGQKDKMLRQKKLLNLTPRKEGNQMIILWRKVCIVINVATSAVNQLIQCEKCEMYLCAVCEKIPESRMKIVGDYSQIHWFCHYCDTQISKVIGQACTVESISNSVQSSVSSCLKEVVDQFTEVVNQAKECLKPITALQEDLPTMETEDRTEDTQQRNVPAILHVIL